MKLQFFGAARTVTGSCHLLRCGRKRVLLDCGMFQGRRKETFERNRQFKFDPHRIDAVVLSHAHIDHSGNLPGLVRAGFKGKIHATSATADLCEWMLRDSGRIQERDVEYVNKRRRRNGQTLFEPLYTEEDAEKALRRFRKVEYDKEVEVVPGVRVRFEDAGHILGSASVHLDCEEDGVTRRIVFTGDIGTGGRPILRDPVPPRRADVLISESTYGDRLHDAPPDEEEIFDIVQAAVARGGRILIPSFAVGRTQHIVYRLNNLSNDGRLPPLPIYVDSPLATDITQVFRDHPECYDSEAKRMLESDPDLFGFSRLVYTREVAQSKALNASDHPCVIIAASGMCEAGRVIHHLKRIAPDPKSTIVIVGYMAPHTLGRRIVERAPRLKLFGEEFPLRATVVTARGLSGHADRDGLLEYLSHLETPPTRTFLVHGEEAQSLAFADHLRQRGFPDVVVPKEKEAFEI